MRVLEPFAGINFVHGGLVFHIALLIASMLVIIYTKHEHDTEGFMFLINVYRVSHATVILYRSVEYYIDNIAKEFETFIFT